MKNLTDFLAAVTLVAQTTFAPVTGASQLDPQQVGLGRIPAGFHAVPTAPSASSSVGNELVLESDVPAARYQVFIHRRPIDPANQAITERTNEVFERSNAVPRGCTAWVPSVIRAYDRRLPLHTFRCTDHGSPTIVEGVSVFAVGQSEYRVAGGSVETAYTAAPIIDVIKDIVAHGGSVLLTLPAAAFVSSTDASGMFTITSTGMEPQSCDTLRAQSLASKTPTQLQVTNSSNSPIAVDWLDYHGQPVRYTTIAPARNWYATTFVAHSWQLSSDGTCLAILTTSDRPAAITIQNKSKPR